jgi:hypothetical protein
VRAAFRTGEVEIGQKQSTRKIDLPSMHCVTNYNAIEVGEMKFYSSKHVCTRGIEEFEGEMHEATYAVSEHSGVGNWRFEKIGIDAFLTQEDAIASAIRKIGAKRVSIAKQDKKLHQLLGKMIELQKEVGK